jgi:hypothetical protein
VAGQSFTRLARARHGAARGAALNRAGTCLACTATRLRI